MPTSNRSKPIEDYAMIGDGGTAALIARDGSVDWLCWPRFDSDACFAALLGDDSHGVWHIAPTTEATITRRYLPDTLILETEFETETGRLRLTDFMPPRRNGIAALVRRLEVLSGEVEIDCMVSIRFGYGEIPPWLEPLHETPTAFFGEVGPDLVVLRGPGLWLDEEILRARISLKAGERADYVLQHRASEQPTPAPLDVADAFERTERHWRDWIAPFDRKSDWPDAVKRSLLTLKALTHPSTGGMIAAATLGLPEDPGGALNWDYRYCWLRDSTFTLTALLNAGFHGEARDWMAWLLRAAAAAPDKMQIMYRIDGGRRIDEWEATFLPGWEGSRPVLVGNAAAGQCQLDVYGELLDSVWLCDRSGIARSPNGVTTCKRFVAHVEQIWREPDQGMWESRGQPQHYVYSKVMAWVAIDRFLKLDAIHGDCEPARRAELEALRDEMHADVCLHGFNPDIGSFAQAYGSDQLDASLLLLPLVGFLPIDDPRITATISAIEGGLMEGGLVRRYEPHGRHGREGVFLACSCWLADCMAMQGRHGEARVLFERVLSLTNDVGLLSEEYHVASGRLIGNFPQALSHIALVNTALGLSGPVLQRAAG